MSTMTFPRDAHGEFVTKEEFDDFDARVEENFSSVDLRFKEQKSYTNDGFDKVFSQLDAVESNLGKKIDTMAADVSWLKRSMGKVMKKLDGMGEKISSR